MTEFVEQSSDYQSFSDISKYEPFVVKNGTDTVYIKTKEAYALNLQTLSEMAFDSYTKVKRVKLKKVTFEEN